MNMNQIINFMNAYQSIMPLITKVGTLYHLSKCNNFCENESKFYRDQFSKVITEYGDYNDDGTLKMQGENIKIIPGKEKDCEEAINNLLNIDVSIPDDVFILLDEIKDLDIDSNLFFALSPFIKE